MASTRRQATETAAPGRVVAWIERRDPTSLAALWLWIAETSFAFGGDASPFLSGLALVLIPGLAGWRLLPEELGRLVRLCAVPIVGLALGSVALISMSAVGLPLTGTSIRFLLLAFAVTAVCLRRDRPVRLPKPGWTKQALPGFATALGLLSITALTVALESRLISGSPVPGPDWGHYLLYADEIARHHKLLIDNPYWMLGAPFREDPGAPTLYGSFILLSGVKTSVLAHGIWILAALGPMAVFVLVAGLAGRIAGLVAALVYGLAPINQDMLGWHGLANVYALLFVPLGLLAAAMLLQGRRDTRWAALLALSLLATAAAHRLTFSFTVAAVACAAVVAFAVGLRPKPRQVGRVAIFLGLGGIGLAIDLLSRNADSGGLQPYTAYHRTKITWSVLQYQLTVPMLAAGVGALVALVVARRTRRHVMVPILVGLAGATALVAFGWVLHIPTVYYRALYFMPLFLAPAVGLAVITWFRRGRLVAVGAVLVVVAAGAAGLRTYNTAPVARAYYGWTDSASVHGFGWLGARLRPHEILLSDGCLSFLGPYLLRHPTLVALTPSTILPGAEVPPASLARWLLYGPRPESWELGSYLGIRYAVARPTCGTEGPEVVSTDPTYGNLVYASRHMIVTRLPARVARPTRFSASPLAAVLRGSPPLRYPATLRR